MTAPRDGADVVLRGARQRHRHRRRDAAARSSTCSCRTARRIDRAQGGPRARAGDRAQPRRAARRHGHGAQRRAAAAAASSCMRLPARGVRRGDRADARRRAGGGRRSGRGRCACSSSTTTRTPPRCSPRRSRAQRPRHRASPTTARPRCDAAATFRPDVGAARHRPAGDGRLRARAPVPRARRARPMRLVAVTGYGQEHDRRRSHGCRLRRAPGQAGGSRRSHPPGAGVRRRTSIGVVTIL